ncbi:MAG: tRNA preQ1(34) S-adenosylmethionine ribosyltransferase-isomerase QueA [Acidobacteria bacterium]|nr:tRNA preQ1(34) S-adenosylmethionine ribosyltransferase-isomerase QueA [Acidobacteriota bacterium]
MRLADFDYALPPELVAQEPAADRDASRLMVVSPGAGIEHRRFSDLAELLRPGDLLVLNNTRVLAARVRAQRSSGGAVELLFIEPTSSIGTSGPVWRAMAKPAKRVRPGDRLTVGDTVLEVQEALVDGSRILRFPDAHDVRAWLDEVGQMPLPPYIKPSTDNGRAAMDRERYQTVYAEVPGAVAAPTAGLHFTDQLFARLREYGIETAFVTLDVGPGTFRPVTAERVEEHRMDGERYRLTQDVADQVNRARAEGRRVVAVGTTSVRALEHAASRMGSRFATEGLGAIEAIADIFITPGYRFHIVDAMITNLHLPRSTPLLMAAAMAGKELLLDAYDAAIRERYRFYSYGDAMLLQ